MQPQLVVPRPLELGRRISSKLLPSRGLSPLPSIDTKSQLIAMDTETISKIELGTAILRSQQTQSDDISCNASISYKIGDQGRWAYQAIRDRSVLWLC